MSDLRRAILLGLLFLIGMMLFNAWTIEHTSKTPAASSIENMTHPQTQALSITPTHNQNNFALQNISNRTITLKTQTLEATIDRVGGNIINVKLLKYPVSITEKNKPTILLNSNTDYYYAATNGFTQTDPHLIFNAVQKDNQIILTAITSQGLKIIKTYTFPNDDYVINFTNQIINDSTQHWQGYAYAELQRKPPQSTGMGPFNFNTFTGAAISSPEKRYEKISFKEMQESNLDKNIQNGWIAMIQHYFLSAWIPNPHDTYHYYSQVDESNHIYTIGLQSSQIQLAPQQQYSVTQKLYVGPAQADKLAAIAPGLNLTVDYGVLWFIAQIIFTVMKKIYSIIGNWGWSIVLVTLIIKILFYKLNAISFKSMAKMREVQPKIDQIRERCGDDRQKLAQATMELYRREKINPMGGCLPLIVQIPVFLSLYWVIVESVELRQAPFILWIHDLSLKDPYYILPLLMGLTIFIQQYLGPKPPDPTQRKIMMMMPVIFTALFLSFPAGLVLYWVINNSLSILQQWYIMKHVVPKK